MILRAAFNHRPTLLPLPSGEGRGEGQFHTQAGAGSDPHPNPLPGGEGAIALIPVSPISRAFAPMVRDGAYDVSEMAIATALMARAAGVPIVLLPVVLAARYQEQALLCRTHGPIDGPASLRGRRVGVRAYSQTTGMWLRGILSDRYGLGASDMQWITFEDAHVAGYLDPAWCTRAPAGSDMMAMLRDGALDAVVVGNDVPDDPALRPVFPPGDPQGIKPVNHIAVAQARVPAALLPALVHMLGGGTRAAMQPSIDLAQRYMVAQGLLTRPLSPADIWAGLPGTVP